MWSAAFAKQAKFKLKQEPVRPLVGANCRPDCDERLDGLLAGVSERAVEAPVVKRVGPGGDAPRECCAVAALHDDVAGGVPDEQAGLVAAECRRRLAGREAEAVEADRAVRHALGVVATARQLDAAWRRTAPGEQVVDLLEARHFPQERHARDERVAEHAPGLRVRDHLDVEAVHVRLANVFYAAHDRLAGIRRRFDRHPLDGGLAHALVSRLDAHARRAEQTEETVDVAAVKLRLGARRDAEAYHAKQRMLVLDAMQRLVVDAHVGLRLRRVRGHRRGRSGSLVSKQLRRVTVYSGHASVLLCSLLICSSDVLPLSSRHATTLKVWRGDARGRREEDYSESHSRTGPRVSSLSGFLVGFRVVPVFELLRRPRLALVLDVFFFN